jgi:class 3 adenylate cyclase
MNRLEKIQAAAGHRGKLEALLHAYEQDANPDPGYVQALAQALFIAGAYAQVLELDAFARGHGVKSLQLSALAGTSAANLGLLSHALQTLEAASQLVQRHDPVELVEQVFATLGRLYKQRAFDCRHQAQQSADCQLDLQRALAAYQEAFRASRGVWSGVNVATLFLLLGQNGDCRRAANELLVSLELEGAGTDTQAQQWRFAALGECALLLGDVAAGQHYRQAAELAIEGKRFAHLASMRRQAAWILQARADADRLDQLDVWLPRPKIAVFTGHRLDRAGQAERLSANAATSIREVIAAQLKSRQIKIAYCALSEGADLLFAQAALQANVELHLVFACDAAQLARDWQDLGLGSFDALVPALLVQASKVYELAPEGPSGSDLDYRYANQFLLGSALLHRQETDAELVGIAVWDRLPARGDGGTATMVQQMLHARMRVHVIDPGNASVRVLDTQAVLFDTDLSKAHQVKALLFADFAGFSKLNNQQSQRFVELALPAIAALITQFEQRDCKVPVRNTWGDGLFLVFDRALDAAMFALALQSVLSRLSPELGFALKLRVALHFAPVMMTIDPVSQRANAMGPSVSRAARLEPATAPGAVYASHAMAAEIALSLAISDATQINPRPLDNDRVNSPALSCRYLANLPWAKGYGSFPTYIVEALGTDAID